MKVKIRPIKIRPKTILSIIIRVVGLIALFLDFMFAFIIGAVHSMHEPIAKLLILAAFTRVLFVIVELAVTHFKPSVYCAATFVCIFNYVGIILSGSVLGAICVTIVTGVLLLLLIPCAYAQII